MDRTDEERWDLFLDLQVIENFLDTRNPHRSGFRSAFLLLVIDKSCQGNDAPEGIDVDRNGAANPLGLRDFGVDSCGDRRIIDGLSGRA